MSGGLEPLALKEDDVQKFLACSTHLGATNIDFQMEQYVYKCKPDGTGIINLRKTWEKLLLAARAIAAIENPADVCVISARPLPEGCAQVCSLRGSYTYCWQVHSWHLH